MVSIDIKDITVAYREGDHALLALDRVSLSLTPGRVTALIGESGSGKTTLGNALMGLLPANAETTGSIDFGGRKTVGLGEKDLNTIRWSRLAMVFQNGAANLNPVIRLADQVAEPLIQHQGLDPSEAREKAEETLLCMGLPLDLHTRYPHELSGGQVQRGLLAMATILDPEAIILDEPTASLDALTKAFISSVILELRNRDKAILLITHDLDLARRLGDDLAVLYLGRVMETMPGRDLLIHPHHPYSLALGRSYPTLDAVRDLGGIRGDAFYRRVHAHGPNASAHTHISSPGRVHEDGHGPIDGCLFRPRCTQAVPECCRGDIPLTEAGGHQIRCLRGGIVNLLELTGVAKRYEAVAALETTDLTLQAGEVLCLVGETGSGKTTLALIAAGALLPDCGRRAFDGRDMDVWMRRNYLSLAPEIGVIDQNPAESVSHRFSVFDIVAEPLRIQKLVEERDEIQTRVLKALSDAHLSTDPEFLRRYPHELNMGAIQRLCIARALVTEPMLLVADEPTSSLDPSVQAKILKMLLDLQTEKGLTMLFVTHDIGLARKIADRIGVMLAGRLVEIGPAARVIGRPGHPYTQQLIESAEGDVDSVSIQFEKAAPDGCAFFHRCGQARKECRFQPSLVDLSDARHLARCFFPLDSSHTGRSKPEPIINMDKMNHQTSTLRRIK